MNSRGLVEHPMLLDACHRQYGEHAPLSLFRAMVMNKPAGKERYFRGTRTEGGVET